MVVHAPTVHSVRCRSRRCRRGVREPPGLRPAQDPPARDRAPSRATALRVRVQGHLPRGDRSRLLRARRAGACCYLAVHQHLPYDRMAQLFADVLGVEISVGALAQMVAEAAVPRPLLSTCRGPARDAPAVHFDETGGRVDGACTGSTSPPRPSHLDRVSRAARHGGDGRHGRDRKDDGRCRPRRLEALPLLRRRPRSVQRPPPPRARGVGVERDQDWANDMIDALLDAKEAVEKAMAAGRRPARSVDAALDPGPLRQARRQGLGRQPATPTFGKRYGLDKKAAQPAHSSRRPPGRRAPFHHRLRRPLRQQPGRARHPNGQAPAEDLGIVAAPRPVPTTSAPSAATSRP